MVSFFGSLQVGTSGLNAQSNRLGIISDNIANVNTVGYKESVAGFRELAIDTSLATYNALGVASRAIARNEKQGILTPTQSTTDIAISGNGFFIVSDPSNNDLIQYTRAGSFTTDRNGNLKNSSGLILQGWPLDSTGNPVIGALTPINIQEISGANISTNAVQIGANLNADASPYPGASVTGQMDPLDTTNANNTADTIIAPNSVNHIQRGDMFTVTTGTGLSYNYTYGGYTIGRNVTDPAATGNGDNGQTHLVSPISLNNAFQTVGSGSNDVIVTVPSTAGLTNGDVISLNGSTSVGGITAAQLTGNFVITVVNGTQFRISTTGSDPAVGGTTGGGAGISLGVRPYTGSIFDATSPTQAFFANTGIANIATNALSFTITTTPAVGPAITTTFSYTTGSPNTQGGQFNSLNTLASAIDQATGLSARVVNGRLYVGAEDGNAAVSFTNGQTNGVAGPPVRSGLDWVGELGLSNVGAGTNRFSTLNGLANNINASTGIKATISNPLGDAKIAINVIDPTDTISFADRPFNPPLTLPANAYTTTAGSNLVDITATIPGLQVGDIITLSGLAAGTYNGIPDTALNGSFVVQSIGAGTVSIAAAVTPASVTAGTFGAGTELLSALNNNGSVTGQLSITPSLMGNPFPNPAPSIGPLGPAYNPANPNTNMASGNIAPQFGRTVTVYDTNGETHDIGIGFIKTATNTWAVEVYGTPASTLTSPNGDGLIASGTLTFNGDGSLATISPSLSSALTFNWNADPTNDIEASSNTITFDWGNAGPPLSASTLGTAGDSSGMSQLAGGFNAKFLNQNGSSIGDLTFVTVDGNGDVVANYSNGDTQKIYRIPVAVFPSVYGLQSVSGNVFLQTADSGIPNITSSRENGAGSIESERLESSSVELSQELTNLIVAQRSYQFSTRLVSTSDELLQNLTQMGAQ